MAILQSLVVLNYLFVKVLDMLSLVNVSDIFQCLSKCSPSCLSPGSLNHPVG